MLRSGLRDVGVIPPCAYRRLDAAANQTGVRYPRCLSPTNGAPISWSSAWDDGGIVERVEVELSSQATRPFS